MMSFPVCGGIEDCSAVKEVGTEAFVSCFASEWKERCIEEAANRRNLSHLTNIHCLSPPLFS